MRNFAEELTKRTDYIKNLLSSSGASGIVYGNSGGKDSALVGILCKRACQNTVGLIMPCQSSRNYGVDMQDGQRVAKQYDIETRLVDLTAIKEKYLETLSSATKLGALAASNINPRLRMIALYAVAASENRLVAGTGNRSEAYMGYFTKWGDGAYDFNPIADLTVTEIYDFLRYLGAPEEIINKAPSAGLYEGQTDEGEMGVTYREIDEFLLNGKANQKTLEIISRFHAKTEHKRNMPLNYKE
jgi:NAD+ synthase